MDGRPVDQDDSMAAAEVSPQFSCCHHTPDSTSKNDYRLLYLRIY